MATVALAALGSAIGLEAGGIAAMVFTTVGSIIDTAVIMPALFPEDPIEGPKLDGMHVGQHEVGSPASVCYGSLAKTPCVTLFQERDPKEIESVEELGKSGTSITYEYFLDCAIALCTDNNSSELNQLYADGALIYNSSSNGTTQTYTGTGLGIYVNGGGARGPAWFDSVYIFCDIGKGGATLSNWYDAVKSGYMSMQMTGWPTTGTFAGDSFQNNYNYTAGTWGVGPSLTPLNKQSLTLDYDNPSPGTVTFTRAIWGMNVHGPGSGPFFSEYENSGWVDLGSGYYGNPTSGRSAPEGTDSTITVTEVFSGGGSTSGYGWRDGLTLAHDPVVYLGDQTGPDPMLQAHPEVGDGVAADTPTWQGVTYISFTDLALKKYGTRIPSFEAVVTQDAASYTIRATFKSVLENAGLVEGTDFDVSGVDDLQTVIGYTERGLTELKKFLQPLALLYDVIAQERNGKIYFLDKDSLTAETIPEGDIGIGSGGRYAGGVSVERMGIKRRLGEVTVSHIDNTNDFASGLQRAATPLGAGGRFDLTKLQIGLPLTCPPTTARTLAARALAASWHEDSKIGLTLGPEYMHLQENDLITFTAHGKEFNVLIMEATVGNNFSVRVTGVLHESVDINYTYGGDYAHV